MKKQIVIYMLLLGLATARVYAQVQVTGLPKNINTLNRDSFQTRLKSTDSLLNILDRKPSFSRDKISFHGMAKVYYHYGNMNYNYQPGPASYWGWELVPQLKVGALTFSVPLRLSTQQRALSYNLNRIAIRFDKNAFRKNLEDKVKERALQQAGYKDTLKKRLEEQVNALPDLRSYKDSLENRLKNMVPDTSGIARRSFNEGGLTDSLGNKIPRKDIDTSEIHALRQKLDSLNKLYEHCLEMRDRYEKLKESGFFDDPRDYLKTDKLKPYYPLSRLERIFSHVQSLEIGNINPVYSPLYIQGPNLSGINTEIQAGLLYAAFTGGMVNQALDMTALKPGMEKRWLLSGRLGLGRQDGTHIIFSYLKSEVKERKLQDSAARFDIYTPDANQVLTTEVRLNTGKNNYLLSEYAVSSTSSRPAAYDSLSNLETGGEVRAGGRLSAADDSRHAWRLHWFFENDKTGLKFMAGSSRTGTFYHTIGNPYLRKDLLRYESRLTLPFAGKRLKWTSYAAFDHDNLARIRLYTTHYQTYNNSLDIKIKRWPVFRVAHTLRSQYTRSANFNFTNQVQQLTLSSSYQRTFKLYHNFSWMAALSGMSYRQPDTVTSTFFINVSQSYLYKGKLNVIYNGNILFTGPGDSSVSNAHQLSASLNYKKGWTSGISGHINHDHLSGKVVGIMFSHGMGLWKNASFRVEAGFNKYEKLSAFITHHRQTIFNAQLIQLW